MEVGAENIEHLEGAGGGDEIIQFTYKGRKIEIFGIWHNDDTAGLGTSVKSA